MSFLAIGLLASPSNGWQRWVKVILAGMGVGMGIMGGFDGGVIYSLMIAAFIMFLALTREGSLAKRALIGIGRVTIVAVFAGLLATQAVSMLIKTQVQGIVGEQDTRSKLE